MTPETVGHIRADALAGMSLERIRARVFIRTGFQPTTLAINQALEGMDAPQKLTLAPTAIPYRRAFVHVLDPDTLPDEPVRRNLWAIITDRPLNSNRQQFVWYVLRSKFVSRGERAYRVMPAGFGAPFLIWAASDADFSTRLLKMGIQTIWSMFPVDYNAANEALIRIHEPEMEKEAA